MKALIYIIFLILFTFKVSSQNLITNSDFEFFTTCTPGPGQINIAPPWYNPNSGQTDYYNACDNSVPCQALCSYYQYPHSGNGYAAIECLVYLGQNNREYIQVQLNSALLVNKCYYVEFYANLANSGKYAVNNIGAFISNTAINTPIASAPLGVSPNILLPGNPVISDTLNWTKIYGLYLANGGEQYLTIGNFKNDSSTNVLINAPSNPATEAYYYIDDVSMYEIKTTNAGRDTTICLGDSTRLGTGNYEGLTYEWQPSIGLSNTTIGSVPS